MASRLNSPLPPEKKVKPLKIKKRKWNTGDIIIYKLSNPAYENTKWYNSYIAFEVIGYVKLRIGGLSEDYFHEENVVEIYDEYWKDKPTLENIKQANICREEKNIMGLNDREIKKLNLETLKSEDQKKDSEISLIGIPFLTSGNIDYVLEVILKSFDSLQKK